ncbi:hypothetical protein [Streptomyces sp. NPDC020917]|uniref:hypothetical protein n=1 Tax=Streptomyces sp. NPDC020917 TaxID=3365102 RepID=UPI003799DBF2
MAPPGRRPGRDGSLFERPYRPGSGGSVTALPQVPAETAPLPADSPAAAPSVQHDQDSDSVYGSARRAMRVLPLGAGLALVGLGLGFLGLRLRR